MNITKQQLQERLKEHDQSRWFYEWRDTDSQIAAMRAFINGLPEDNLTCENLWKLHGIAFTHVSKYPTVNELVIKINSGQLVTIDEVKAALGPASFNSWAVALGYEEPLVTKLRACVVNAKLNSTIDINETLRQAVSPVPFKAPAVSSWFNWWRGSSANTNKSVAVAQAEPEQPLSLITQVRNSFSHLTPWYSAAAYQEKQLTAQVLLDEPTFKVLLGKTYQATVDTSENNSLSTVNQNALTRSIHAVHVMFKAKNIILDDNNLPHIEDIATVVEYLDFHDKLNEVLLKAIAQQGQYAASLTLAFTDLVTHEVISAENCLLLCAYPEAANALVCVIKQYPEIDITILQAVMATLKSTFADNALEDKGVITKKCIVVEYNLRVTAAQAEKIKQVKIDAAKAVLCAAGMSRILDLNMFAIADAIVTFNAAMQGTRYHAKADNTYEQSNRPLSKPYDFNSWL